MAAGEHASSPHAAVHTSAGHAEEPAESAWFSRQLEHAGIPPFVVSTWLVAILLLVLAIRGTRRLSRVPKKDLSGFLELCHDGLASIVRDFGGPGLGKHLPFIGSLFLFIVLSNLWGVIPGFVSPTGAERVGLNTTLALAIVTFLYVQYTGFREQGIRYLLHFVGEPRVMAPINIIVHTIGELARPLSLSFRLFGNIGGEDKILVILGGMLYMLWLHIPLTAFAIFTGLIQGFVFSALACSYISGATGHEAEHAHEGAEAKG